jgi:hypothetical protein
VKEVLARQLVKLAICAPREVQALEEPDIPLSILAYLELFWQLLVAMISVIALPVLMEISVFKELVSQPNALLATFVLEILEWVTSMLVHKIPTENHAQVVPTELPWEVQ